MDACTRASEGSLLLGRIKEPQRRIAKRIGVSQGTISGWRAGHYKPQKQEHRDRFRTIYGIPNDAWDRPTRSLAVYPLAVYPLALYPAAACTEVGPSIRCAA